MRHAVLFLFFFFVWSVATAQDIIIFQDSSTVKANVIELTESAVIYSHYGADTQQKYTINKHSIMAINFEDGRQETFKDNEQNVVNQDSILKIKPEKKTAPLEKKHKKGGFVFKLGLAMPLGDFAADPNNTDGSFGMFWGDADFHAIGQTGLGYMIGAYADIPITKFGLGLFISLDVIISPLNKTTRNKQLDDFTQEVEEVWGSSFVQGFDAKTYESGYVKNQLYFNIPLMAGLSYTYPIGKKHRFFVDAGVGANILNASTLEGTAVFDLDGTTYILDEYYDWKNVSLSFSYKVGIGTVLWNKFAIDIHYSGLGKGSLNYKYQRTTPQEGIQKTTSGSAISNVQMLTLSLGYYL